MDIDGIAKIAGVLGFFISVATFIITRWERRSVLSFGLERGDSSDYEKEIDPPIEIVTISIANLGVQPVFIDLSTLAIFSKSHTLFVWQADRLGVTKRDIVLKPNESMHVGLPLETFLKGLEIKSPKKYDDESYNIDYPVRVMVKSAGRKTFKSGNMLFWEAVGEFFRP